MVKYTFELKEKYVPDLTQKTDKDNVSHGIRLVYSISKIYSVSILNKEIILYRKRLGLKTFLRPYKKVWDKRTYRLPYVYWGKASHPLTRHWVVIPNDCPLGNKRIIPETSFIHQKVKLFGHTFRSKDITSKLFVYNNKFNLISIK